MADKKKKKRVRGKGRARGRGRGRGRKGKKRKEKKEGGEGEEEREGEEEGEGEGRKEGLLQEDEPVNGTLKGRKRAEVREIRNRMTARSEPVVGASAVQRFTSVCTHVLPEQAQRARVSPSVSPVRLKYNRFLRPPFTVKQELWSGCAQRAQSSCPSAPCLSQTCLFRHPPTPGGHS